MGEEFNADSLKIYQLTSLANRELYKKGKKGNDYLISLFKSQLESTVYAPAFADWCNLTFKQQIDKDIDRTSVTCDYCVEKTLMGLSCVMCCPDMTEKSINNIKNVTPELLIDVADFVGDTLASYFWGKGFIVVRHPELNYSNGKVAGGSIELKF